MLLYLVKILSRDSLLGRETDFGQKLVFVLESHTIFCPTHKVLHVNCMTRPALAYQLHDQPQRSPHATAVWLDLC